MPTVAITGSAGKTGRYVAEHFLDHGYEVRGIDLCEPAHGCAYDTLVADLTDAGQAIDALVGCDQVVHLAAIPAPGRRPDPVTYHVNTQSTYNVFYAAMRLKLPRVVWASSETLLGLPLNHNPPAYVPIDEALPVAPQSSYALSKQAGEEMGDYFWQVHQLPSTALRLSNVMTPGDYEAFEAWQDDPQFRAWNLWGYIDARDVGQACRLAIETQLPGAEAFILAADDTVMRTASRDLMAATLPGVPIRDLPGERATLLSNEKARRVLGFRPEHGWS